MTTITEDKLAAQCLPILRRIAVPVTCIELARLLRADSSAVFRALISHPEIETIQGYGLTQFKVKT